MALALIVALAVAPAVSYADEPQQPAVASETGDEAQGGETEAPDDQAHLPQDVGGEPSDAPPPIEDALVKTMISGFPVSAGGLIAGARLTADLTIDGCFSRTLYIQQSAGGAWVTKQTYELPPDREGSLTIIFPDAFWQAGSTTWRIFVPASGEATAYTSPAAIVGSARKYQNPSGYLQLSDTAIPYHGTRGTTLKQGMLGSRVRVVNIKLGVGSQGYFTATTTSKVKSFQKKNGLSVTGAVNLATWTKLGYSAASFVNMDNSSFPLKADRSMTRAQLIETMIDTAYEYRGNNYVVGASGSPAYGVDCSGLIFPALYSVGLDPLPSNTYRHAYLTYEYESYHLWYNEKLKHVSYANRTRGDLIFYQSSRGNVNHIALYLGNNQILHSYPGRGVVVGSIGSGGKIKGVARPII
jgi:cell wall-associated NlpC family hydrolase